MVPSNQAALNELIHRWPPSGRRVLELGATPETARGFRAALPDCEYVGVDLDPSDESASEGIIRADANALPFEDASFDAVITASMFEHNPRFWASVAEARRVLVRGGRMYVSVPGFTDQEARTVRLARRIRNRANRSGWHTLGSLADLAVATRTYPFHMGPNDYFRFSPQAMQEVLLDGLDVLEVRQALQPPRIHGVGEIPLGGNE